VSVRVGVSVSYQTVDPGLEEIVSVAHLHTAVMPISGIDDVDA
jgi:hypothetical protein